MSGYDERDLFQLCRDVTARSGCFGPALAALYGLAVGMNAKRMLELGVGLGGTTRALLLAAKRTDGHVWSVDVNPDVARNVPEDLHSHWTLLVGRTDDPKVREEFESDVFVDDDYAAVPGGTLVDWQQTLMQSGFVFRNPNVKTSCSCGESFTI